MAQAELSYLVGSHVAFLRQHTHTPLRRYVSPGLQHFANFGWRLKEAGLATAAIREWYSDDLPVLVEVFLAEWSD